MKKIRVLHLYMIAILLFLTACGTQQEVPTPTIDPSATPIPTPSAQDFIENGSEFLDNRQYEDAEQAFKTAIEIAPDSATAHAKLALTYLEEEVNFEEMLAEAQKAVDLNPEDGYNHAVLAYVQSYQQQDEEALKNAEAAYEKNPENDFVAQCMAYLYLWNNDFDKSWAVLEQLVSDYPEDDETYNILGEYFFSIAEFGTAQAAFLRAVELAPENLSYKNKLAYIAYIRNDHDRALTIYEEILAEEPADQQALIGMIDIHLDRYEFDIAAEKIDQFAESNPDDYHSYMVRGNLMFIQEEYSDAVAEYNKVLEINPYLTYPQFKIGYSYIYQDECERARIHFQDLVEEYPHVLIYQIGESNSDLCTNRVDQAINTLKDVIEKDPYSTWAYMDLGYAYTLQSRWQDAENTFVEAMAVASYLSPIHGSIGRMLNNQGNSDDAEMEFFRAIELDPYNLQAYFDLTFMLLNQDRLSEASETIQKAFEINPQDAGVLYAHGITNYHNGNFAKAIQSLEQTLEKDPEYYYAHLFIGLAKRSLGQYKEARNEIEIYLALMEGYLPEEEVMRVTFLMEDLDNGYLVDDEEALDSINEFIGWFELKNTNPRFETIDGQGKTLICDLNITPAELKDGQFNTLVGLIMAGNTFYVPRVNPTADGGAQINVKMSGRHAFTVGASLSLLEQYADTLISPEDFIASLSYTMPDDSASTGTYNRIITNVATLRQIPLDHIPPQKVISKENHKKETEDRVDDETWEAFNQTETMLMLLEVIPTGYDYSEGVVDIQSDNIAGYYVPSEDQIILIEGEHPSRTDQLVLAHESTHALQYQNYDMNLFFDSTLDDDHQLAFLSLIEGDATLLSIFYLNEYVPIMDQLEIFSISENFEEDTSQKTPAFMLNFFNFPYDYGLEFVNALYEKGGWEEVSQAYENPPISSEQILHPESYFNNDVPRTVDLTSQIEKLAGDWEEIDKNVMGEYGIYLIMEEYFGPFSAYEAARGWGGDQYILLKNTESGTHSFLIQIDWDDLNEAEDFWTSFMVAMNHRNEYQQIVDEFVLKPATRIWYNEENYVIVHLDGGTTYLLIGADQAELEQILDAVLE